jgi:hypothetical protein
LLLGWALLAIAPVASAQAPRFFYDDDPVIRDERLQTDEADNEATHEDWMSWIPDTVRLMDLSLPGTHDTMADCDEQDGTLDCVLEGWTETQGLILANQLRAGIRVLDIRLRNKNNLLDVHHGPTNLGSLGVVVEALSDFLTIHPTETILMALKSEYGPDGSDRHMAEVFKAEYWDQYPSLFWTSGTRSGSYCTVPTLGDVRGKVVLITSGNGGGKIWDKFNIAMSVGGCPVEEEDVDERLVCGEPYRSLHNAVCPTIPSPSNWCEIDEKCAFGLRHDWGPSQFSWQDEFNPGNQDEKLNLIVAGVGGGVLCKKRGGLIPADCQSNADDFFMNYTSASAGLHGWPATWATLLNEQVLEILFTLPQARTGIVFMDFPGSGLIDAILARNLRFVDRAQLGRDRWAALRSDFAIFHNNIAYSAVDDTEDGNSGDTAQDLVDALDTFWSTNIRCRNLFSQLGNLVCDEPSRIHWLHIAFQSPAGWDVEDHGQLGGYSDSIDSVGLPIHHYRRLAIEVSAVESDVSEAELVLFLSAQIPILAGDEWDRASALAEAIRENWPESDNRWGVFVKPGAIDLDEWASSPLAGGVSLTASDGSHSYLVWGSPDFFVPEPSRWLMLLTGVGMLLALARWRGVPWVP